LIHLSIILVALVSSMHIKYSTSGAFSKTCTDVKLDKNLLKANCADKAGKKIATELNLDGCFSNQDGKLSHSGSGYALTCTGCNFDKNNLKCNCKKKDGKLEKAEFNIDNNVSNIDGKLTCDKPAAAGKGVKFFSELEAEGAFIKTSKDCKLDGSKLNCQSQNKKGAWVASSIDLDTCFSNQDGKLSATPSAYAKSCSGCKLDGSKLNCECKTKDGKASKTTFDIDTSITNNDGKLECDKVAKKSAIRFFSEVSSTGAYSKSTKDCKLEGNTLKCSAQNKKQAWVASSFDLNKCFSNQDGKLQNSNTDYSKSCTGCALAGASLNCACKDKKGASAKASVDLDKYLTNDDGVLVCDILKGKKLLMEIN